jgi:hypothetical protein
VTEMAEEISYTPTEDLFMETLSARVRLGEPCWTFDTRHTRTAKSLEAKGLIRWKSGIVEKTILVWITELGKKEWLSFDYKPPILKDYKKKGKK